MGVTQLNDAVGGGQSWRQVWVDNRTWDSRHSGKRLETRAVEGERRRTSEKYRPTDDGDSLRTDG